MAQMIIEIEKHWQRKKGDILVYNGSTYTTIQKDCFLKEVLEDISKLKEQIETLNKQVENLEKQLAIDHGEIEMEVNENGME